MTDDSNVTWSFAEALQRKQAQQDRPPVLQPLAPGDGHPYAEAALAAETEMMRAATKGHRNDTLNIAAFNLGQLVAAGHLSQERVDEALRAAALSTGLPAAEVDGTLASGGKAGLKLPRQVEARPTTEQASLYVLAGLRPSASADSNGSGTHPPPGPGEARDAPGRTADAPQEGGDGSGPPADPVDRERTSWWPQPVLDRVAGDRSQPVPSHLQRSDGVCLFYAGKVNGLIGESESGKSWVMLHAVVQTLQAGQPVVFLDFEDAPEAIAGRLRLLGCTDEELGRFHYANPAEGLGAEQTEDLAEALRAEPALIVLDGVNAAMTLLGLDINSNTDATVFAQKVLRPLAATGAAVGTVDHVPKNADQRGKGGIGAQAKRAMVDGALLRVEVAEPFGVGQSGSLRLLVDKDRPGQVRGASQGSLAGRVQVTSTAYPEPALSIVIEASSGAVAEARRFRPTGVMEQASLVLESVDAPVTWRTLTDLVVGKHDTLRTALNLLVTDGYVKRESGVRRSTLHSSIKPYRELDELSASARPTASQCVPGRDDVSASVRPTPYRGGRTQTHHSEAEDAASASPILEGYENCNGCGQLLPSWTLDRGHGYCPACVERGL